VSRAVRAGARGCPDGGWWVLSVLALALGPSSARADRWSIDNSIESRLESNDNVSLSPSPVGTVNTLSFSTALNAARQMENEATRVNAAFALLRQQGRGGQDRVDGRLGLNQSFSDALNSVDLGLQYAQDFNNAVESADVALARGRRRTTTLSAAWSRPLSERLGASAQWSLARTGYGRAVAGASDFRNQAFSGGLSYQWTEIDSSSLQLSRSDYRTEDQTTRSITEDISLGLARAASERASVSLSVGAYRTVTTTLSPRAVCPLPIGLCQAGLVPFTLVEVGSDSAARGALFSASYRYRLDETTDVSVSAARRQTPSGAGAVVRNDTFSAQASRGFSPTLTGSIGYAQTRSARLDSAGGVQPRQRTFSLALSEQLAPDLSLSMNYQRSQARGSAFGGGASSNSVSVALKFDWLRFEATR
jgi:hypothetical protein